jgi:poly(3-hydroxybutyrate) depolymerase
MRNLVAAVLILFATAADAEKVKIPWKGDYAHNFDDHKLAKPDDVYVMGRSNGGTAAVMIADARQVRGHQNKFAAIFAVSSITATRTTSRPTAFTAGTWNTTPKPTKMKTDRTLSLIKSGSYQRGLEYR